MSASLGEWRANAALDIREELDRMLSERVTPERLSEPWTGVTLGLDRNSTFDLNAPPEHHRSRAYELRGLEEFSRNMRDGARSTVTIDLNLLREAASLMESLSPSFIRSKSDAATAYAYAFGAIQARTELARQQGDPFSDENVLRGSLGGN